MSEQEYYGCTDGNCIFGHPGGMHTNGGCRCLSEVRPASERIRITRGISQIKQERDALRAEVDKLMAENADIRRLLGKMRDQTDRAADQAEGDIENLRAELAEARSLGLKYKRIVDGISAEIERSNKTDETAIVPLGNICQMLPDIEPDPQALVWETEVQRDIAKAELAEARRALSCALPYLDYCKNLFHEGWLKNPENEKARLAIKAALAKREGVRE